MCPQRWVVQIRHNVPYLKHHNNSVYIHTQVLNNDRIGQLLEANFAKLAKNSGFSKNMSLYGLGHLKRKS